MKLKKVEIHGFRSIEEMEISFDNTNYKILVGKNESGKSNILNALNLLSGDVKFEKGDKKKKYEKDAYIMFYFDLNKNEIDNCQKKFFEKILVSPKTKLTEEYTLETFFKRHSTYILYKNDCNEEGRWKYWALPTELQIIGTWYVVKQTINEHNLHTKVPAESYINEDFINKKLNAEEQEIIQNYISKIDIEVIYQFLREIVKKEAAPDDYHFPVTNWRYKEQYNLPSSIKLREFSQNPNLCLPLKNMFLLAGIQEEQIEDEIVRLEELGVNYLTEELFDNVTEKTNKYINENWKEYSKEYKDIKIELWHYMGFIQILVKDSKNTFDFQQRSDGFRRFISFLLLMSTKTVAKINSPLILIDEPETGLHPSSAKDLKNTLIKLSQYNTIVYATHSISMIDAESIENNLIISKENENTTFEIAREDGISPAENIFQAIGYSIYNELKKENILLEGYSDKKILKTFMKNKSWKQYGICYTGGLKNIENVISFLDLASRKYFVLSDADRSAIKNKSKMGNLSCWFTYKDLDSEAITIEDFYKKYFFQKITQEILEENEIKNSSPDLFQENDRIKTIKIFLHRKKIEKEKIKIILDKIKSACIEKYKEVNIEKEKIEIILGKFLEKIQKNN